MSMKYVVIRSTGSHSPEELFIFPAFIVHAVMVDMLRKGFPRLEVVSAGTFNNYVYRKDADHIFDQVGLSGESTTLKVRSRSEDLELFWRSSMGA
jgi:hypothetical protein